MVNKNPRDMPELKVVVVGNVMSKEDYIHLNPLESKRMDLLFDVADETAPQISTITVKLVLGNFTITEVTKSFEVLEYKDIVEETTSESYFFTNTKTHTITNNGNVADEATKTIKVSWYKKVFTSFTPKGKTWTATLAPGETYTITQKENYQILVALIVIALLSTLGYYVFRSPLVVKKKAYIADAHGERTHIKIQVELKNRSKRSLIKVHVADKIPNMAAYVKKKEYGTLEPSKITGSEAKGTTVKWDLDILEAGEERIFTYTAKCKLKIVGGMSLPPGRASAESEEGKKCSAMSKRALVEEH